MAINEFKVGDVLQKDFGKTGGYSQADLETDWRDFSNRPIQDQEQANSAREIVETNGGCMGWATTKLNDEVHSRSAFRTVGPELSKKVDRS